MALILIIDDLPYLEEMLLENPDCREHTITTATNGEEAMAEILACRPDIVLLEVHFQGLEGWDLLHRIKLVDSSLPVLIVTAFSEFINNPHIAEADGYILKDIYPDTLNRKIKDVLNRHALDHKP